MLTSLQASTIEAKYVNQTKVHKIFMLRSLVMMNSTVISKQRIQLRNRGCNLHSLFLSQAIVKCYSLTSLPNLYSDDILAYRVCSLHDL